jgi:mannose-6-phosphate isomerase-like protein (cupin superfamily)
MNESTASHAPEKSAPATVNLQQKLSLVSGFWNPAIVGELNDSYVKVVKLKGEFIWHHHDNEDELFLVVKGELHMKFRDREETIRPGEFIIVPRGVEHLPIADEEVHIVLFEPKTTLNTGNLHNDRTVAQLKRI